MSNEKIPTKYIIIGILSLLFLLFVVSPALLTLGTDFFEAFENYFQTNGKWYFIIGFACIIIGGILMAIEKKNKR